MLKNLKFIHSKLITLNKMLKYDKVCPASFEMESWRWPVENAPHRSINPNLGTAEQRRAGVYLSFLPLVRELCIFMIWLSTISWQMTPFSSMKSATDF